MSRLLDEAHKLGLNEAEVYSIMAISKGIADTIDNMHTYVTNLWYMEMNSFLMDNSYQRVWTRKRALQKLI